MADRSFTLFPAADVPMKKLYVLPDVEFLGPSRVRNKPLRIPIVVFSFQKVHEKSTLDFSKMLHPYLK